MTIYKFCRFIRTVRYLKLVQILNRFYRKLKYVKVRSVDTVYLRAIADDWVPPIQKPPSFREGGNFIFLNREERILGDSDWNDPKLPKLWLYNLHYHDGLGSIETCSNLKATVVSQWINHNPIGKGNGWEPYPLSLRIVNWIKWRLDGGEVAGMDKSLFYQAAALSQSIEYHLLGNHLFANAKALVYAGLFFQCEEAEGWLSKGLSLVMHELSEQFLSDGGHFERSTSYHATLTEDLLDLVNIMRTYGMMVPNELEAKARKAITWAKIMTRPDGCFPLFNDSAYGISPDLTQLVEYSKRLNMKLAPKEKGNLVDLPDSGYFRYDGDSYSFWGDAGPIGPDYVPGHAHCDMFSFELFTKNQPLVVDAGTSTYDEGERRMIERSTASHNTVQLEGFEQSEVWAAFRVGRRARVVKRSKGFDWIDASHDGFKKHGATHRRHFKFAENEVIIKDYIYGRGDEVAVCRFHLHPGLDAILSDCLIQISGTTFVFSGANHIEISDYYYAPEFNKLVPAKCIEVGFSGQLRTSIFL